MTKANTKATKKPILTILIPVYNTQDFIKKCLNSLIDPEIEDKIEVIIVSDGSKDDSIRIARTITDKHSKMFNIVEKENGGHGSTINVGIKKARGKYFRVLDSDDWFDKDEFIKFVKKLEYCNSDLVITDYSKEFVNKGISQTIMYKKLKDSCEYDFQDFNLELLGDNFFAMATITYKTSILQDLKFQLPEKTFYVDMLYDVIPILKVNTFTYFDCNIYKYYIGREGQSVNTSSYVKNHLNHNNVCNQLISFFEKNAKTMTKVKKDYLLNIIKTVINTNYAIYGLFFKKKIEAYKNIKRFDKNLKCVSKELYASTNKSMVKFFRLFQFFPVLLVPNFIKMSLYKKAIKAKNKGDE